MRQYRYVMAASDGTSYDFARHAHFGADSFDLPDLLNDGWRPVRETPLGEGTWMVEDEPNEYSLVLILLEKKGPSTKKGDSKKNAGA